MFACTNSCMNPIVYGAFNIRKTKKVSKNNNFLIRYLKYRVLQDSEKY